jgi:hypothetical protein
MPPAAPGLAGLRVPRLWRAWVRECEAGLVARGWPVREARRNARLVMRRDATGEAVPCLAINLAQAPPWLRDRAAAALAPALID